MIIKGQNTYNRDNKNFRRYFPERKGFYINKVNFCDGSAQDDKENKEYFNEKKGDISHRIIDVEHAKVHGYIFPFQKRVLIIICIIYTGPILPRVVIVPCATEPICEQSLVYLIKNDARYLLSVE